MPRGCCVCDCVSARLAKSNQETGSQIQANFLLAFLLLSQLFLASFSVSEKLCPDLSLPAHTDTGTVRNRTPDGQLVPYSLRAHPTGTVRGTCAILLIGSKAFDSGKTHVSHYFSASAHIWKVRLCVRVRVLRTVGVCARARVQHLVLAPCNPNGVRPHPTEAFCRRALASSRACVCAVKHTF